MAFINPSNLYSGGQVKFDASPYIRLAEQRKAKREAAELATDKYFTDMLTKIDTGGAREQDAQGINDLFNQTQSYWINNKDKIKRGGAEQLEFMKGLNAIRQTAAESKRQKEMSKKIAESAAKGLYQKNKYDIDILAKMELPIDDDRRYKDPALRIPYTEQDLKGFAKPWTAKDQSQLFSTVTQGAKPQLSTDPNDIRKIGNTDEIEATLKYTPDQVKQFALSAGEFAVKNPSKFLDVSKLAEDASVLARYDKVIEQTFGKEFSLVKDDGTPEELKDEELIKRLAMAETAENMLNYRATIRETDPTAQRNFQRELQNARLAHQRREGALNREARRKNAETLANAAGGDESHPFDKDIKQVYIFRPSKTKVGMFLGEEEKKLGFVQGGVVYSQDGLPVKEDVRVEVPASEADVRIRSGAIEANYGDPGAVLKFTVDPATGSIKEVITPNGKMTREKIFEAQYRKQSTKPAKNLPQNPKSVPSQKPKSGGWAD